jgi:hypothetical protein
MGTAVQSSLGDPLRRMGLPGREDTIAIRYDSGP